MPLAEGEEGDYNKDAKSSEGPLGWDHNERRRQVMIYDSLKHMEAYQGVHPGIYKGLELLRDTDFSKLEDARVEVDGEDLFYLLQSYESKPANDTPEAHKKYVDIQFLISGREKMGVGVPGGHEGRGSSHPGAEIWFYHGPLDEITLGGDKFVAPLPLGDAHAPTSRWTDLSLYASAW